MTKFSDFIRNLGTAGPATLQGIYDLGFALRSEWPGVLAKYVRVDAAQSFTSGEQLQGRENIGAGTIATQDADAVAITGGSIAGITDLAVVDGGTGASSASAARTNLGLGNVDNTSDANKPVSTATQTALNLKANLASPALTGTPVAPTAAPGTNTTQIATTAYVLAALLSSGQSAEITLSGTSQDIAIPAGVTRVTLILVGASSNGSSGFNVQLGDAGGIETSGYLGTAELLTDETPVDISLLTSGFSIRSLAAGRFVEGHVDLVKGAGNTWSAVGGFGTSNSAISLSVKGSKTLSDTLTTIRLVTGNGTDVLNAGTMIARWS